MPDDDDDLTAPDSSGIADPIVRRAHARWLKCHRYETDARNNWLNDYKFCNGDVYNNYQWPVGLYNDRGPDPTKPCLTINEVREHNLHIKNEARQHKTEVKYRPEGDGASAASAEVLEGLYRAMSNASNAQMAQTLASGFQIDAGLGWTHMVTEYVHNAGQPTAEWFNQTVRIEGVQNPLAAYLDCDCHEVDGTGSRYGFLFEDKPNDEILAAHPELKGRLNPTNAVDGQDGGWVREDHTREALYYEITEEKDELIGNDEGVVIYASQAPKELIDRWEAEAEAKGSPLRRRDVVRKQAWRHLIVGTERIKSESRRIPGTSVPLIPWIGEQTIIEKRLDRKGHTRAMISPQQVENYNWSGSVEYGALQSKTPYLAPLMAIEELMTYWETANTANHSFLPYKHRDDDGQEIPPPTKVPPPGPATVYLEGVTMARQFMMAASGQYEADMGQQSNERSGTAINQRQRQGDRATYHFIDNQALSIRRQGTIFEEWVREIYDTERVARIIGLDGQEREVLIRPNLEMAHQIRREREGIQELFNPTKGRYAVVSDVGPDYATQRQEAFNAIVQILVQAPQLINVIGDLLFKVADFPLAEEIAERLKPGLSPEAFAQLQAQLAKAEQAGANTQKLLQEAMQALSEERLKAKNYDADNTVKAFDADTKRLTALQKMLPMDPEGLTNLIQETVRQALQDNLGPIVGHLTQQVTSAVPDEVSSRGEASGPAVTAETQLQPIRVPNLGEQLATPGGQ